MDNNAYDTRKGIVTIPDKVIDDDSIIYCRKCGSLQDLNVMTVVMITGKNLMFYC